MVYHFHTIMHWVKYMEKKIVISINVGTNDDKEEMRGDASMDENIVGENRVNE